MRVDCLLMKNVSIFDLNQSVPTIDMSRFTGELLEWMYFAEVGS